MMFKKFAVFLFIALYFSSTSGFALNLHFCGQKLAKIQLNAAEPKSCCATSAGKPDHCCKNEKLEVQVSDQHQAVAGTKIPNIVSLNLLVLPLAECAKRVNTNYTTANHLIKPPPSPVSIGLKNCVFRI